MRRAFERLGVPPSLGRTVANERAPIWLRSMAAAAEAGEFLLPVYLGLWPDPVIQLLLGMHPFPGINANHVHELPLVARLAARL